MKYKVKYTRKEYREEYLKSDEWINLRKLIMDTNPNCQCCAGSATDVHHLVYRNIVDIKITDLIPVCRSCHDEIHFAIDCEWISQNVNDFENIKSKTLGILKDPEYKIYKKWIKDKHFLTQEDQELIKTLQPVVMKKISGLVKRNVWYDSLGELKFTGRQLLQIKKFIEVHLKRKQDGLDKQPKRTFKPKVKTRDDISLKNMDGFRSRKPEKTNTPLWEVKGTPNALCKLGDSISHVGVNH